MLVDQQPILCISCLETPRAGSGPRNPRTEPPLASLLAISLPCTPACPGTQYSPTTCRVEISLTPLGTVGPMEMLFWWPEEFSKLPDYQSRYSHILWLLASSCLSVLPCRRLSAWNNLAPTGQIFMKVEYFFKTVERIQVLLKSDKNYRYFTQKPTYIFDHISLISS